MFTIDHQIKDFFNPLHVRRLFGINFAEHNDVALSQDDILFLDIVKTGIDFESGHYVIPFPLKRADVNIPNNHSFPQKRMQFLKKCVDNDEMYK